MTPVPKPNSRTRPYTASYFGQGALLLAHRPGTIRSPFYSAAEGLQIGGRRCCCRYSCCR